MDMSGIQVTFVSRELDRSITNNVGRQDVKGIELSARYAATDRLTLSAYLAVMKGQIVEFNDSVCTPDETVAGLCRDAAASMAEVGDLSLVGTINRSNVEARNAPDWQISTNARYELPTLLEGYYSNVDVFFMASDDILTNRDFSRKVSMKRFADMNLSMEIGGVDERWSVTVYGRNLFAPKPTYFPEFDLDGEGILSGSDVEISLSNFTTYGLRFNYKFF
jgi:outer membrane receptor protein involved in Fe transport